MLALSAIRGLPSAGDQANWSNALFEKARSSENFLNCEAAWTEQRDIMLVALETLEASMGPHAEANKELATRMRAEVGRALPSTAEPEPIKHGFKRVDAMDSAFACDGVKVRFDGSAGKVCLRVRCMYAEMSA